MNGTELEQILDSGWNPPVEKRVELALELLIETPPDQSLPALEKLVLKFRAALELQTKNMSGSGNQQDTINAYIMAYESAKKVYEHLKP